MNTNKSHILKWRFDISTFRLIGRDLITDRVTALFELVKNCYDANAQNVTITFNNVSGNAVDSSIIIEDDGVGFNLKNYNKDGKIHIGLDNVKSRVEYVNYDEKKMQATYVRYPQRSELNAEINESLIVEYYSRV